MKKEIWVYGKESECSQLEKCCTPLVGIGDADICSVGVLRTNSNRNYFKLFYLCEFLKMIACINPVFQ